MTTFVWGIFLVFGSLGIVCLVWSNIIIMDIKMMLNTKLPPEKRYALMRNMRKSGDMRRQYREFFPDGNLLRKSSRLLVIGLVSFFGSVAIGAAFLNLFSR
jgi:hypothetical protein